MHELTDLCVRFLEKTVCLKGKHCTGQLRHGMHPLRKVADHALNVIGKLRPRMQVSCKGVHLGAEHFFKKRSHVTPTNLLCGRNFSGEKQPQQPLWKWLFAARVGRQLFLQLRNTVATEPNTLRTKRNRSSTYEMVDESRTSSASRREVSHSIILTPRPPPMHCTMRYVNWRGVSTRGRNHTPDRR